MSENYEYWAFISYSHQDNLERRKDGQTGCVRWAEWLLQALETYRVPAAFRGRTTPTGEPVPERLFPVFQDEKELPLNGDLGQSIEEGLKRSRYLIVICSPNSAASFYVNEEVRYFKALGRQDRIFAWMIAGEPNASEGNKSGVTVGEECFCPALRHPLLVQGDPLKAELDLGRRDPQEPIAGDVRLKRGNSTDEPAQSDMRGHADVLEFMKLKLVAGLIGVGFDELVQRDKARQAAEMRRRIAVLVGVVVLTGLLAVYALWERGRARQEARRANQSEQRIAENASASHFELAKMLMDREDVPGSLAHLAESLRNAPGNQVATGYALNLLLHREWPLPEAGPLAPEVKTLGAVQHGRHVLTWLGKNELQLWDSESGKSVLLDCIGNLHGGDFSADGQRVLTTAADGVARIWDANSGLELKRFEVPGKLPAIWADDERRALVWEPRKSVRMWDLAAKEPVTPEILQANLVGAKLSWGGRRILTITSDNTLQVWNPSDAAPMGPPIQLKDLLLVSGFSADGGRVLTSGIDGVLRISATDTGEKIGELKHVDPVWTAASTPAGERLVTRTTDGAVRIWDSANLSPWCAEFNVGGTGFGLSFSPDGSRLLVPSHGELRQWNIVRGRVRMEPMVRQMLLTSAQASQERVLTSSWDGTLRVWSGGKVVLGPLKNDVILNGAGFSPDERRIMAFSQDGTIRFWDALTGNLMGAPVKMPGRVTCAIFSPDGSRVAAGNSEGEVWLIDVEKGSKVLELEKKWGEVGALAFHKDGRRLASAAASSVYFWDAITGERLECSIKHQASISSLVFSPDGKCLLTASSDRTARIWDPKTSKPLAGPLRFKDWVSSARFSKEGDRFVTATRDGTIGIWETGSNRPLAEFGPLSSRQALGGEVLSANFTSDGRGIVVAMPGGVYRVDVAGKGRSTEDLARLIESLGGQRWNPKNGQLEPLPRDDSFAKRLGSVVGTDEVAVVLRWFSADRKTRPISPWSGITQAQWTARRLQDEAQLAQPAVLEEILLANPADPPVLRALAVAIREKDPARADYLEAFAKRLEGL